MLKKLTASVADYFRRTDKVLWLLCFTCSGMSLVLLSSQVFYEFLSIRVVMTQAIATAIGVVAAVIISKLDIHGWFTICKYHVEICWALVLATFVFGIQNPGADDKAWLPMPFGMTFQPTELAKLSFIFTFAMHLNAVGDNINQYKNVLMLCLHGAAPILLIHLQGDDGTALAFAVIFVAMLFAAGISWRYVLAGLALAAAAVPVFWNFILSSHQKKRFLTIFNPELDPQGVGFQPLQSKIAIGSGKIFGLGLFGDNVPREVPYMRNDFIFSYVGQTMGFIGCLLVVGLLLAVAGKTLFVARRSADKQGYFVCVGIFAVLLFQILANVGMCIGVMPVIGLTLPFFSAGGTSVMVLYLAIGIVMSVYMNSKTELFT